MPEGWGAKGLRMVGSDKGTARRGWSWCQGAVLSTQGWQVVTKGRHLGTGAMASSGQGRTDSREHGAAPGGQALRGWGWGQPGGLGEVGMGTAGASAAAAAGNDV